MFWGTEPCLSGSEINITSPLVNQLLLMGIELCIDCIVYTTHDNLQYLYACMFFALYIFWFLSFACYLNLYDFIVPRSSKFTKFWISASYQYQTVINDLIDILYFNKILCTLLNLMWKLGI